MEKQGEVTEGGAAQQHEDVYVQLAIENQSGKTADNADSVTLDANSFDKIGPKAKEILTNAGVESISIAPGKDGACKIEANLKEPLEIPRDPEKDGCNALIVGKKFSADFSQGANGELILENIKGLKADTNLGVANVVKIKMSRDAQGNTEIESVGRKGIFSRTRTKTESGEVMDKAESVLNKLDELKQKQSGGVKMGYLTVPPLQMLA